MMYCSREGGCCYWFHCDSRCLCRPQRCQGLHLQSQKFHYFGGVAFLYCKKTKDYAGNVNKILQIERDYKRAPSDLN